jgi:hypothetical protein
MTRVRALHLVYMLNTHPDRFALHSFNPCTCEEDRSGGPAGYRPGTWTLTSLLGSRPADREDRLRHLCEPYLSLRATLRYGNPAMPTRDVKPLLAAYDDVPSDPALLEEVCLGAPDPQTLWAKLGPLTALTGAYRETSSGTLSLWLEGGECL